MCIGDHMIKSWSTTQSVIALSAGEAELYALNKASATTMGLKSLPAVIGVDFGIEVITDGTTGKAMATRKGLETSETHRCEQVVDAGKDAR